MKESNNMSRNARSALALASGHVIRSVHQLGNLRKASLLALKSHRNKAELRLLRVPLQLMDLLPEIM